MQIFYTKTKKSDEHFVSRLFLTYLLKEKYNILNPEIIVQNKKPKLTSCRKEFSITHSNGLVAIGFDDFPVGIDIEFIKPRNLNKFNKRYEKNFKTQQEFYEFWTKYEAKIKLQQNTGFFKTFFEIPDFVLSVGSINPVNFVEIIKVDAGF